MTRKQARAIAQTIRARIGGVFLAATAIGCLGDGPSIEPQGSPAATDLPCEVETVLAARCWACHGDEPTSGLPSLTSAAALRAPSRSDPTQPVGAVALARMQASANAMPPLPAMAATATEIATIASWLEAGASSGSGCGSLCTSGSTWNGGDDGSPEMNPGMPCNRCHASDEGPRFSIAGTIYATAREPDLCNGAGSSSGAQIEIAGADGRLLRLVPNRAGNFFSEVRVAVPYRAKVVTPAGERVMTAEQTSGDCNGCHTPAGADGAPGRIVFP
jgi:hypothetical protein